MPIQNYSQDYVVELLKQLYQQSNTPLPQAEFDTLERLVNEERAEMEKQRAWIRIQDDRISSNFLDLPFDVVYSNTLETNVSELTIQIPSEYKHLFILAGGRITAASGGNVWAQFNGDTGATYGWVSIFGDSSAGTTSVFNDATDNYAALGLFGNSGDNAETQNTLFAVLPNIKTLWRKTLFSLSRDSQNQDMYIINSGWRNTSPITSITIKATDGTLAATDILAGSIFSIYGLK